MAMLYICNIIRMTHNERLERTLAAFRKNAASNQEERSREN